MCRTCCGWCFIWVSLCRIRYIYVSICFLAETPKTQETQYKLLQFLGVYLYMLTPDRRVQAFRVTSLSWLTFSEIVCTKCSTSGSADCVLRLPRLWQETVETLRVYCEGCPGFVLAGFVEVLLFYIHSERHNKTLKPSVKVCFSYQHLPSSDSKVCR